MINCKYVELFLHGLPDGLAKLVGTGGVLETATYAFQTLEHFINFHAIYQSTNALGVAVAAAVKLNILQNTILDFKLNGLTAGALGSIGVFHWI